MPGFVDDLLGLKNQLRSGDAFEMLSGMTPDQIGPAGKQSAIPDDRFGTNAPSHAATTEAISGRFGPLAANLVGVAQEIPSGFGNVRDKSDGTGNFVTTEGESGFSIPDLMANAAGAGRQGLDIPSLGALTLGALLGEKGGATRGIAREALQGKADQVTGAFSDASSYLSDLFN